jgi:thiol reductant ABC exporter CydC subunit
MRALWQLARRSGGRRRLLLAVVLGATTYLCAVALTGLSAWLISRAAEHPEASALTLAAVGVRALGLGRGLSRYGERLVGHDATLRALARLRVEVFGALAERRGSAATGQVLSRVVSDVEAIQDLWLRVVLPIGSAIVVSSVSVAACWWWEPAAGFALLTGFASSLVLLPLLGMLLARREAALAGQRADYVEQTLDVVHGCADLLACGAMDQALGDAEAAAGQLAEVDRRNTLRAGALAALGTAIQALTVLAVAYVGLTAVHDGRLPRVGLAVVVLVALASFEPVLPLAEAGALVPRTWGAAVRLLDLLGTPPSTGRIDPRPLLGADLRLDGVLVTYPGAAAPALEGVDLDVPAGRSVAVVGPSASGKSTLLAVLAGQLAPTAGSASLGGQPVHLLDESVLSGQVVLAEQEAHLFDASIRDNLRIARPDASDAELRRALDLAGLAAWVSGLPKGWDTVVGERGSRVSGGERKRLSVARAVLSPAPVLLLDEPTEGLDAAAADAMVRGLLAGRGGRTLVLVTHRYAALEGVDEVVVLDGGAVVSGAAPALTA